MIKTKIEKVLMVTRGTWVSYTLEMGCRWRFEAKSSVATFRISLDTVDWFNAHIQYTLIWLIKVRGQERHMRVQCDITYI